MVRIVSRTLAARLLRRMRSFRTQYMGLGMSRTPGRSLRYYRRLYTQVTPRSVVQICVRGDRSVELSIALWET